jgi:putative membrane protein
MEKSLKHYLMVTIKGLAMGAADIVPGVSGGTIAFITGIYEELINSINAVNLEGFRKLFRDGIVAFWKHINGNFLVALVVGIGISILSLASLMTYLLEYHPILIWSFFFGLIIASIWLVGRDIKNWNFSVVISLLIGITIAYYISSIQTVTHVDGSWYIFLSGMIAICAMILPGISGSFILVLMGSYYQVLGALRERDLILILIFLLGCVIGILSFARLLKFLFTSYKTWTIALLTGFMIGALYKVWPWKKNVGSEPLVVHSDGREEWMTTNVLPSDFSGDPLLLWAIVCVICGLGLVVILERMAVKK